MPEQPAGPDECLHSFPDPYPQPLDQPGNCRGCDSTYQEAKAHMPATTVVTARSVSLNITGYPDVPNLYGEGHIAPSLADMHTDSLRDERDACLQLTDASYCSDRVIEFHADYADRISDELDSRNQPAA